MNRCRPDPQCPSIPIYPRKNKAFTITHTTPGGQATAITSLHDFITTPFLPFHNHLANPLAACSPVQSRSRPRDNPGTARVSTISPNIEVSLAFAAADQSAVETMRGIVTRRFWKPGRAGAELCEEAMAERFEELARRMSWPPDWRKFGVGVDKPRPVLAFDGMGRK